MDNFNPASLSTDAFNKLTVPTADEVRRKNLEKLNKPVTPARTMKLPDEIAQAEKEEAEERAGLKQPIPAIIPANNKPKEKRIRVTFELPGGFYTIPAKDVKLCKYGLMVLMPTGETDAMFAPSPGSEVTVIWDERQVKCFSPGIMFDFKELNCMGIVLIRADDEHQTTN